MLAPSYTLLVILTLMVLVIAALVAATISAKSVREARARWHESRRSAIEPALEEYLITGERQAELEAL
ncbi:MAG: hypothetical protein L0G70_05005, partial [Rubrobacter sp.]|nr:hypothetical protein [Rubrobacter sp.]